MGNRLFLLNSEEQEAIMKWNNTYKEYPLDKCLHEIIEEQVRQNPNNPAVRFEYAHVSFAELNVRSNKCARYLRGLGIGPDSIVGVLMERSIEMVIALLGILKAGGAYLPLDPAYPDDRLMFMLEDAGVSIVLTQDKYKDLVNGFEGTKFSLDSEWDYLSEESGSNLESITTPEKLAYVIYTSGSTGKPKGCMLPHLAICNRLIWMQDKYQLTAQDRVLQKTPFTFDVSVWEFFWPLLSGACLVMAKPEGHKDSNYLVDIIRKERITTCHFVPSMLRYFVSNPNVSKCDTLRQVFTSGEALSYDLMMDFKRILKTKLHNLYGPTEAAVDVTYWECEGRMDKKVPIGRPISNIQIHILDGELNKVPIGEEGELHIGGIGLAIGYLNRPELTAEKFINDPYSTEIGAKLYKTGDKARYLPDGNIEYLGRIDFQVKLRGNRIELGEIETVLKDHEAIAEAVVLVKDVESGDPKLVAYIVAKGELPASKQIREFIKSKLPDYMVPNIIVPLDSIPVTQHGKLDRHALPWPIRERVWENKKTNKTKPETSVRTSISAVLLEYLEKTLDTTGLTFEDDLFDLGATSLTLVQMVEKIQKQYSVSIPVEVFLNEPTIKTIVDYLCSELEENCNLESSEDQSVKLNDNMHNSQSNTIQIEHYGNVVNSEKTIKLNKVQFKEAAYLKGSIIRNYVSKEIQLGVFSRFLSLLKQITINGGIKYLYPTSGGLNAVQTYLYIKENTVEGLKEGIYYYHPVEHALYLINALPEIDRSIFFEYDRNVFDNAGFVLFFIAQLDSITPIYQMLSPTLVTLDAGYMGQLLLSRQTEFNLGLCPVGGVDFDRISDFFKLDESHRFIHCMLGGSSNDFTTGHYRNESDNGIVEYLQKTGKYITEHLKQYTGDRTFASFLDFDWKTSIKNMKYLSKEEHELFHAKHLNIRRFSKGDVCLALAKHNFQESDYLLRSSRRDYINKPIPIEQFSKFMSLLKPKNIEGKTFCLYPSISGIYGIQAYIYIKENRVEGLAEGIYYYHPVEHMLVFITSDMSKNVKPSYTPFNRKHYEKAAFCLFLVGQINMMKPIYQDESLYFALLEAGYIGQLLMDKQAEFDIGVCPIGSLDFDRIRSDFKLADGQVLLHSFICGSFAQEIPRERRFLEIGRGEKETEIELEILDRVPLQKKRSSLQHDIAIVGISGRYPGAENLDEYWENILDGKNSFIALPESRKKLWRCGRSNARSLEIASSRGGYLEDIDCFDSLLFNISPSEARTMDPQERLFMEVVWECLENAGYNAENLICSSGKIGVFVGAMWNDYQNQNNNSCGDMQEVQASAFHSSIANRISYFFNFSGPSIALNTSCSSAMTALHFACESIKRGECDAALVGGVNLITHSYHHDLLTSIGFLSKDGESRPLGAHANGWLPGEGAGVILIKPIEDAERDNDYIHGIIKGTAIGHSGRTTRFGAPSSSMQSESIQKAIDDAGISAESISYIESAAAGASIADATEMNAIKSVFQNHFDTTSPCLIGSLKANIGHLESASAMSQITKVLLQMKHRMIAPTINFKPINPLIQLQGSGLEIVDELKPWSGQTKNNGKGKDNNHLPLRALINAFGSTGSGGHVIIEEYVREENKANNNIELTLIPFSAASGKQLNQQVARIYDFLTRNEPGSFNISDIGYTLRMGRVEMDERLAVVVDNTQSLVEKLEMFLRGEEKIAGFYRGAILPAEEHKVNEDRNDLFIIAEQWVQGALIEWSALNNGSEKRVPLPTYPFAKERHWVKEYLGKSGEDTDFTNETAQQSISLTTSNKGEECSLPGDTILLTKIEEYLKTVFAEVSEIPVSRISPKVKLEKYGISSLMIKALNIKLEKDFGELSKTLFFEYQSIYELAKYFLENHRDRLRVLLNYSETLVNMPLDYRSEIFNSPKQEKKRLMEFDQEKNKRFDIAIIGLSGRYPKARTLEEYWENLKNEIDCITEIPMERWDYQKYYTPDKHIPGKTYCKWGGFIDDVDKFDPLFFNISPREAEIIDPQERLFLETVWHTFEDAGYNRKSLLKVFGGKVGIYVGVMYGDYQLLSNENMPVISSYGSIANRISYIFDFHGPSMAIDTLCSSSLTALHLAVESIKRGECEAAIAGGVNISLHPNKYIVQAQFAMSPTDGKCRSFGEGGDGFVPGEGVGAVLLKPLQKALEDGDQIYGVIKGISVNHDGKTNGYTVPNPIAQSNLILDALIKAEIDPRTISYVEAHGTGTSLGDPIEITGISKSFAQFTSEKQYCSIGSVKSNIGHLESAAGVAGLTKVLLQMKYKQLVPSLHSSKLNPNIIFENTPFYVQQELTDWNQPVITINGQSKTYPRRASISSFGAGGVNAHVVIEEYEAPHNELEKQAQSLQIIVLSASNEQRLQEYAKRLLNAIQEQQFSETNLPDIAYTLQVGREAMEERLAVIVGSLQELEQKLNDFVEGQDNIEDLYRGQVKSNNETVAIFEADEELHEAVDKWIRHKKYAKLLDLWVKGLNFDWNKLYSDIKPRRVTLPTYPFARERYWVPESKTEPAGSTGATSAMAAFLNPLLQQNTSNFSEQRFSSTFTGQEFFLADHIVKGQRVLPGVAFLEMARAAVEQAATGLQKGQIGVRLKNVVWVQPIIVGNQPVHVHIGLFPEDSGEIIYEIYSKPEADNVEPIVHSQGIAVLTTVTKIPTLDLKNLQVQCGQSKLSSNQCYEAFRALGFDYGPGHRGIEKIYVGQDQALAKLSLPFTVSNTQEQFVLHPSLMDAALQALISLIMDADDISGIASLKPALPFALQEIEIFGSCVSAMWAFIRYSDDSAAGGKLQKLDIDLCDDQGNVRVRMKGLLSRVLEGEIGSVGSSATLGTLMLEPKWKEQAIVRETPVPAYAQHLVMLCEPGEVIHKSIESHMNGVRCLRLESDQNGIEERFQTYVTQVFAEIQSILKEKPKAKVLIQIVISTKEEQQLFSGLSGLLKTARLENPRLIGQLIEVEQGKDADRILEILQENSLTPNDHHVRYQANKRLLPGWSEVEVSQAAVRIPWKDRGIYLITGGAGGLGLIFAREIAHKVKGATLILTGRSPLSENKQVQLKELAALGVRLEYKQVDVTQKKTVVDLIHSIGEEFGSLHGIIHSAGVIKDNFIIKKTREELQAVLAPKVRGLANLDQASKDLRLDFFILFSSISGSLGNPGQADYTVANAFMDDYARYRNNLVALKQRQGKTLSINWPLWKEGGMHVDEETKKMMRENVGMVAIETLTGIRALYQSLAYGQDQVMVIEGDLKRLHAALLGQKIETEALEIPSSTRETKAVPAFAQDLLQEKATNYFKKLVSSVIKLPVHRIEADAPMEKYGIDSVMVMQLTNQLEKTFGSLSKTLFFEHQNIKELAGYFLQFYHDQLTGLLDIKESTEASAMKFQNSVTVEPIKSALGSRSRSRFASPRIESREEKEKGSLDIAIIGVSGRYPQAENIWEFWQNLRDGKDCITEIPKDRWDHSLYFDEDKNKPGKTYSKWGGFLNGVDQFDPLFFNITPREAEIMDPQERLFLECVYEAIEDAGYTREALGLCQGFDLEGNIGVYVGVMYEEYQLYGIQETIKDRPSALFGSPSSIANRVSYFCNFHGPSMAVDTMCSSSLTAIHLACQSLQRGGCELAVAGGVNVSIHPNKYLLLSQGKFVSSKGRCESFGQGGDGYVPGEGVGVVMLKPLTKAIADRDHIYGIIKATAINHGGKTNGYTVPNPNAQASIVGQAYRKVGIDPRTISYIEAHGTGTSLGDPIEIAGLTKAFRKYTNDKQFCAIGSAKSNIGHCESAAGIAGVTKVLLQLKHHQLVPSLHSAVLNPNIDFSNTPFVVQQKLAEWKRPVVEINGETKEYPRIAGISCFGAGGSNAHVVIEEYMPPDLELPQLTITSQDPVIVVLSAKSEELLKEQAQRLATAIQKQQLSDASLADMAYTLQVGREAMEERLGLIVGSIKELEEKLKGFMEGQDGIEDLYRGQMKRNKETVAALAADEEMQEAIDKWIQRRKYSKLLDLWVKGLIFDWNKLYGNSKPQRISLPTYPFARKRYWVSEVKTKFAGSTTRRAITDSIHHVETKKVILVKDWQQKTIKTKTDRQVGVVVVLGTVTTTELAFVLFADMEAVKVIQVIHGETNSPAGISTDFYSISAGEYLYQQIKGKLNGQKFLGVIDLTAYDSAYEQAIAIESGKLRFIQKLIEHDRNHGYKLLQVTHQLHAFQLTKTTMEGARLAGLYRMLGAEYKQIQAMTMDSDYSIQDHKLVEQIQTEFLHSNSQENLTESCYRNDERYEPQLTVSQTNDDIQKRLHIPEKYNQHDVVLITGGSRGIGASIAEYVVSQGVKNLVIMGREELPEPVEWKKIFENKERPKIEEKLKHMQAFINQGVRVHYYNTSLTDQEGIRAMVDTIRHDLGPITGVFHCAGLTSKNPAFFKKTLSDMEMVCEPKMKGLVTLHKALEKEPLTFFVLFSSISSVAPTLAAGHSDYAMANAYMDYYALHQAGEGRSYFKSIQWPAWGETGMAAGGMRTPAYMKAGLVSITTADGLTFLDSIKQTSPIVNLPCVVVPGEFTHDQLLKTDIISRGKESSLMPSQRILELKPKAVAVQGLQVDLRAAVVQWLQKIFMDELKLTVDQLEEDKPFDEYGIDSIILAQLVQTMQERVGNNIDPSLFLEYSTIAALVDYFMRNHPEVLQKNLGLAASSTTEVSQKADNILTDPESFRPVNTEAWHENGDITVNQSTITNAPVPSTEDIAVVGLSCRFPGSPTTEAYWDLLTKGVSAIKPVSEQRWISKDNRVDYGGWVDDLDLFDPEFFNINENDAVIMDPQARIILEESLRAIYDAGYEHKQLSGQKIGVYIGGRSQPNMNVSAVFQAPNPILGIGQNYLATNISRFFNFTGPSLVVDTACSSGITSLLFAADCLRGRRIDMAMVGAVNLLLSPFAHDMFAARNILSKNGEFHIFDKRSGGEVLGEGAGIVMLKRLSDAIKDGNHIYGIIKAIAVNNDGRTLGPGSPNINGQKQVIQDALMLCGKQPEDIGYIEVNGGGSPTIDSVEIKALSNPYHLGNQALASCYMGSVKPNLGHLLLASGMAGFIRCVLSVYHKQIPPFLSALAPFDHYDFAASRIQFNRETIDWKVDAGKKRIAAQNSFPDGGTNCHVLVEEFVPDGRFKQQYSPKMVPSMVKKRFPIPPLAFSEPCPATTVIERPDHAEPNIHNFKEKFKKKPDLGVEHQEYLPIRSVWGEIR